jgi:hypothetical protein
MSIPLLILGGAVLYLVGQSADVTDKQQAQARLLANNPRAVLRKNKSGQAEIQRFELNRMGNDTKNVVDGNSYNDSVLSGVSRNEASMIFRPEFKRRYTTMLEKNRGRRAAVFEQTKLYRQQSTHMQLSVGNTMVGRSQGLSLNQKWNVQTPSDYIPGRLNGALSKYRY